MTAMNSTANDAQTFLEAARLNRADPLREGCLLRFPDYGQLVMTGDIHGHRRNFSKLQKYADLAHCPARHVILHEIIHAEPERIGGDDPSLQVLIDAAEWKTRFPDQIHFLQSNHEMAQMTGKEISKGGRIVNLDFERSLVNRYGQAADEMLAAIRDFIDSFPLAGRTANRVFVSHSLPNLTDLATFDPAILQRALIGSDFREGGDAYLMVWGRYHPPELLEKMSQAFDVDWFLCGHQPQETGAKLIHDRMIILASDHNHGAFLPFDLKKSYTIEDLLRLVRPFSQIE